MDIENLSSEELFALAKQKAEQEKRAKEKQYRVTVDIYNPENLLDEVKYIVGFYYGSLAAVYEALDQEKEKQLIFYKDEIVTYSSNYYVSKDGNSCYYDEIDTDLLEEIKKEK